MNTPDFILAKGVYELPADATISQAIDALQYPITDEVNITFLEGWNIFDYDAHLTQLGLISAGEFITYAENPEKISAL